MMKSKFSNTYLESFINRESSLGDISAGDMELSRVKELLSLLDNPQKDMKIIHVAGSKGKGSTCVLIANILKSAGYSVGLYTSPHIHCYTERIRILDQRRRKEPERPKDKKKDGLKNSPIFSDSISEKELKAVLKEIKPQVERLKSKLIKESLSFYEIYTVLAFFYFKKKHLDFVVLETGLGGRLDATNVVSSLISVITSINLEHTKFLGNTLKKIAREKAGIIKKTNKRVIIAPQEEGVLSVLKSICQEQNVDSMIVGEDINFQTISLTRSGQVVSISRNKNKAFIYKNLRLALKGTYQSINAAVAIGAIEALKELGFEIKRDAVYQGLEKVFWPIRFECVSQSPLIIIDAAHTVESCEALRETVKVLFPEKNVVLLLGISTDKNVEKICHELNHLADTVIFTKAGHPRASKITDVSLAKWFPGKSCFKRDNSQDALQLAKNKSTKNSMIIVAGSIFVASEVRQLIFR